MSQAAKAREQESDLVLPGRTKDDLHDLRERVMFKIN
jgi:hypothetical protein